MGFKPGNSYGRFKPGQSGNPSGRPKVAADIREGQKDLAPVAFDVQRRLLLRVQKQLIDGTYDEKISASEALRLAADLIDRVQGKATQTIETKGAPLPMVMALPEPAKSSEDWEAKHGAPATPPEPIVHSAPPGKPN